MALDKNLYRQAFEWYRQWNLAEARERYRNAANLSPQEAWRQYVSLWEFAAKYTPEESERQQRRRMADWDEYYARIQKFENWRKAHGQST